MIIIIIYLYQFPKLWAPKKITYFWDTAVRLFLLLLRMVYHTNELSIKHGTCSSIKFKVAVVKFIRNPFHL